MTTRQLRELEDLEVVMNKKRFGIGIVLCCIILIEFCFIIGLTNKKSKTIIQEVEVIQEIEVIKEIPVEVEVEPTYAYNITSAEREMLARIVYREGNIESLECQKAIASVVINRWQNGYWGDTLEDVIYAPNQFSPSGLIWKTTPTETNYRAVDEVLKYGCTLPDYVLYFRASYHFSWHGYQPYTSIDRTYFGYMEKDRSKE